MNHECIKCGAFVSPNLPEVGVVLCRRDYSAREVVCNKCSINHGLDDLFKLFMSLPDDLYNCNLCKRPLGASAAERFIYLFVDEFSHNKRQFCGECVKELI